MVYLGAFQAKLEHENTVDKSVLCNNTFNLKILSLTFANFEIGSLCFQLRNFGTRPKLTKVINLAATYLVKVLPSFKTSSKEDKLMVQVV